MFGLTSLIYVRDYVQGLQSQLNPSACRQDNDELFENFLGVQELPTFGKPEQRKENIAVEASSAKLGSCVTQEPSLSGNSTSTPLGFLELDQNEPYSENCIGLAPKGNVWNPPFSHFDSAHTNGSQEAVTNSEPDRSSKHDHGSGPKQGFSGLAPQRKSEHDREPRDFGEKVIRFTPFGPLTRIQSQPQRHVPPLPSAFRSSDRNSSPIAQSCSKFRPLSPLRESSGIIHHCVEIEQQSLVVQKTRNEAKSVLHSSKPADSLCQPVVRKRSLKSFLSPRSSFAEDYTNDAAFLGRYRTPSSPELCFSQPFNPLYSSQPTSRATSLSSLRHLTPDKERSLYIGVSNHKLFLPPKSNGSSSTIVTYRPPLSEERKIPSMTPYAIIGPSNPDKLPIEMPSTTLTGGQPTLALDSAGGVRRGASTLAIAGSTDSFGSDETLVEAPKNDVPLTTSPGAPNPVQPRRVALFFDELSAEIIQRQQHREDPANMLRMMDCFAVAPSSRAVETNNSPQLNQKGFYHEFSESMTLRRTVSVNSKTSFLDEHSDEINQGRNVSGNEVQLSTCKQNPFEVLTDHDEAYACWHPKTVEHRHEEQHMEHAREIDLHSALAREFESSISAGGVCTGTRCSLSFVEDPAERATTRQHFAVSRHSTSLSDPAFPSPLVSLRLRGPSFAKESEKHMLTLMMSPVGNSVPFAGRRSSTVSATPLGSRSIAALSSKKSKGFWAKLGTVFKGCFSCS